MAYTPPSLQDYLQELNRRNPGSFLREVALTLIAGLIIGGAFLLGKEASWTKLSGAGMTLGMAISVIVTMIGRYGVMRPSLRLLGRMLITLLGAAGLSLLCFVPLILAGPDIPPVTLLLKLLGSVTAALVLEEVSGLRVFSSHLLYVQAYERHLRAMRMLIGPQEKPDR